MALNPMTPIIDGYRDVLLRGRTPGPVAVSHHYRRGSAVLLVVAWVIFHRAEYAVRRERVAPAAWAAWALLALVIIAGSSGRWSIDEPGVWAPILINPADVARNVALYVPFGALGMLALGRSDLRGIVRVTGVAILFSFGIEALQLYTVDRVASLTDMVSAGVGSAIGAGVVAVFARPK